VADDDTLFEFPCDFPIKAMGEASAGFEAVVLEIVQKHAPDLGDGAVRTRPSRNGRYLSITVTIRARDKQQLDAIYADLSAHRDVLMAL
jgi:putative lipoic acid-binding regulatory protein